MPSLTDEQVAELARQQATQDALAAQGQAMAGGQTQQDGPGFFESYVKPAALPTALGIAGNALGAPLGPPASIALGAVGSGIGEGINQLTGITEPNLSEISKAMFYPAAIGMGLQAVKPLMAFAGSGQAAQTLNALAPEEAAAAVGKMTPKVPSSLLFKQASEAQVKVPMNRTLHTIDTMLDDLTNVSSGVQKANSQVIGYLKGLKNLLGTSQGLSPQALQRELEGAGNVLKSVNTKGGTGSGAIKQVFKAMTGDLDDAVKLSNPAQVGAQALTAARDAFKKESVLKEIGEAIDDATRITKGQGGMVQFNPAAVLREIGKNKFYDEALSKAERTEIESLLKLLNKIPALRPGAGATWGSGHAAQTAGMAGAGAAIGGLSSNEQTIQGKLKDAAIGAGLGGGLRVMGDFGRNVSTAMHMRTGRALMKELLTQSKGSVTPQVASVIAAYANAVQSGQVQE